MDTLNTELEQFGTIEYLGINNERSFIIVTTWNATEQEFITIADKYVKPDYPILENITFIDGTIKAEYNKI